MIVLRVARMEPTNAERPSDGPNTRFVVTNLTDEPAMVYGDWHSPRGDAENHIKEPQLDLFANRTRGFGVSSISGRCWPA
jgi:hypothetical protein